MSSDVKGLLSKAAWLTTAIGSINWGLRALGFDLFSIDFIRTNLGMLEAPVYYLFGAAGIFSLVMFFTCCCSESCK